MTRPTDKPPLVLVVEDEPLVRMVVCEMLADMDIAVIEASDGEDGLARLRDDPSIRMVITDISMPRMDGISMLSKARESRADLLALFMSGQGIPPPGEAFIRKPYRMQELRAKLVQMLGLSP